MTNITTEKNNKNRMKEDKIIDGSVVRKNPDHRGLWDVMDARAGQLTGKVSFTGTLKEIRDAAKLTKKMLKGVK